jgi:N-acetylglucosamine kinase-like BadF-type ATPase
MPWKIGVDGGGTKIACILVDPSGSVAATHTGPGCNPSIVGAPRAGEIARDALRAVRAGHESDEVSSTMLFMAGSRAFWKEFGEGLAGYGRVSAADDSVPILELATRGSPGLVLHAGTGSFVAARTQGGATYYAGGLGWRFGDEGSGYDIGTHAVARALLELQGWAKPSGLSSLVRERAGGHTASDVAGHFHAGSAAHAEIAALAPDVLRLAGDDDAAAGEVVTKSVRRLLDLAVLVSRQLFLGDLPDSFRAGVSGPILNHPFAYKALSSSAPFPLAQVTEPPIEGVRLLLSRTPG